MKNYSSRMIDLVQRAKTRQHTFVIERERHLVGSSVSNKFNMVAFFDIRVIDQASLLCELYQIAKAI